MSCYYFRLVSYNLWKISIFRNNNAKLVYASDSWTSEIYGRKAILLIFTNKKFSANLEKVWLIIIFLENVKKENIQVPLRIWRGILSESGSVELLTDVFDMRLNKSFSINCHVKPRGLHEDESHRFGLYPTGYCSGGRLNWRGRFSWRAFYIIKPITGDASS